MASAPRMAKIAEPPRPTANGAQAASPPVSPVRPRWTPTSEAVAREAQRPAHSLATAVAAADRQIRRAAGQFFQAAALCSVEAAVFFAFQNPGAVRAVLSAPAFLILGWLGRKKVKRAFLAGCLFYAVQTVLLIREGMAGASLLVAYVGTLHCIAIYRMYRAYDLLERMEESGLLR